MGDDLPDFRDIDALLQSGGSDYNGYGGGDDDDEKLKFRAAFLKLNEARTAKGKPGIAVFGTVLAKAGLSQKLDEASGEDSQTLVLVPNDTAASPLQAALERTIPAKHFQNLAALHTSKVEGHFAEVIDGADDGVSKTHDTFARTETPVLLRISGPRLSTKHYESHPDGLLGMDKIDPPLLTAHFIEEGDDGAKIGAPFSSAKVEMVKSFEGGMIVVIDGLLQPPKSKTEAVK